MPFPPSWRPATTADDHASPETHPFLDEEKHLSDSESIHSTTSTTSTIVDPPPPSESWRSRIFTTVPPLLPRPPRPTALLRRTAAFLVPSPLSSGGGGARLQGRATTADGRLAPTAYLDGIRGVAAFAVFMCHYLYTSFVITEGFGVVNPETKQRQGSVLTLPFVRLLYSGPPMVCVFFVVSGYSLALRPLRMMRGGQRGEVGGVVGSMAFRRVLRLYLPTAISTFMVVVLLRLGVYEWNRGFSGDKTFIRNVVEYHPPRLASTCGQVRDWMHSMFQFLFIWSWQRFGGSTLYDVHLWTIPVEFRASMVIFLVLIATAGLKTWARMVVVLGMGLFSYLWDKWEMVLFLAGLFLAELDLIRLAAASSKAVSSPLLPMQALPSSLIGLTSKVSRGKARRFLWPLLSVLALYLMGQPDQFFEITPGWVWLSSLIPSWFGDKYRYWQCVGSVLFVASVSRVPGWKKAFEHPVSQYLGRISYALYLMHGPVIHTIGYTAEKWSWGLTGTKGWHFELGFGLASLVTVPATIWAADVFARGVDQPCVRFARWVETRCKAKD